MDIAQAEFEKTMLKAPRSGIIGDKSAEVGEFVTTARKIVSLVSIVVYLSISTFMIWESRKTLSQTRLPTGAVKGATAKHDPSAFKHVTSRIQRLKIFPMDSRQISHQSGMHREQGLSSAAMRLGGGIAHAVAELAHRANWSVRRHEGG